MKTSRILALGLLCTLSACSESVRSGDAGEDACNGSGCPDVRVCAPGRVQCTGPDRVGTCNARGTGWVEQACPANQGCGEGRCQARVCTPGAGRCESDAVARRCAMDGLSELRAECALTERCRDGTCTCVPHCEGLACGDDGCGGTCGACAAMETCLAGRCLPPGYDCVQRHLDSVVGRDVARGTTVGAGRHLAGSCGGMDASEVALAWTAPAEGTYTFTTAGSGFDTLLYLRAGCLGRELGCNDDVVAGIARTSTLTVTLAEGQTVVVVIDGWSNEGGPYVLNIQDGPAERCTPGATQVCYSGPAATDGVGRCHSGRVRCYNTGVWLDTCSNEVGPAAGEVCANSLDDDCDGMTDEGCGAGALRTATGRVTYQRYAADAMRHDWAPAPDAPATGFAVFAFHGDTMVDATVTATGAGHEGEFTLRVPDPAGATDRVVVSALAWAPGGVIATALADPGLEAGDYLPFGTLAPMPRVWSWSWRADAWPSAGALRIADDQGAGAAHVFEWARRAVLFTRGAYGREGSPLLVWMGYEVGWDCGACFGATSTRQFGQTFPGQIAYPGGENHEYWAEAVITHEVGHWVMQDYGVSPGEGGAHRLNSLQRAGLAWSEGYASWYGATVRDSPVFIDKQGDTMFWFDISARTMSRTDTWARPSATGGLLQMMAENEVSAMMWALAPLAPRDALHLAVASPRMTVAPFARGYRNPRGQSVPVLPDFLDALVCGGFPRTTVDAAVRPYPYDSTLPRCPMDQVQGPLQVRWEDRGARPGGRRLAARITQDAGLPAALRVWLEVPPGVTVQGAPQQLEVAPAGVGAVSEVVWEVLYDRPPQQDLVLVVDSQVPAFGLHARHPWRFGRPAPRAHRVPPAGARVRVHGVDLGPAIPVS